MPSGNQGLTGAKRDRNDEFHTRLEDIEDELQHYRRHFKNQAVHCNCDDPTASKFVAYFAMRFTDLGLKSLTATCRRGGDLLSRRGPQRGLILNMNAEQAALWADNPARVRAAQLEGDGDFRSAECAALLQQADIVATNPPFSLFREHLAQLAAHRKKFLILGSMNGVTYKEVFNLFAQGRVWYGRNAHKRGKMRFRVPAHYDLPSATEVSVDAEGSRLVNVQGIRWFTNLQHAGRRRRLALRRSYSPADHPRYDNYDAIEVGKVADIPCDYDGVMGVPISFLDRHDPSQFDLLGLTGLADTHGGLWDGRGPLTAQLNGRSVYRRLLIRRMRAP